MGVVGCPSGRWWDSGFVVGEEEEERRGETEREKDGDGEKGVEDAGVDQTEDEAEHASCVNTAQEEVKNPSG